MERLIAIATMSLGTLPQRLGSASVIVVGIAGVVAVCIGLLSLASGFRAVMETSAQPDRALVLRAGSTREVSSYFSGSAVDRVAQMPGVEIASGELLMQARLQPLEQGGGRDVVVRAIDQRGLALRDEVVVTGGRAFEPGKAEVIVGRGLLGEYANLNIGDRVPYLNGDLRIVGHFSAAGTAIESEILVDLTSGRSAYRRGNAVNAVRVRLADAEAIHGLRDRLEQNPDLDLWVLTEAQVLAEPTARRARLIGIFAAWIVGIMALGGLAAALTTMQAAVDHRLVEIGTLRALGFGPLSVLASVLLEALLLALVGALIGAGAVAVMFDGARAATTNPISGTAIAFAFVVTSNVVALGVAMGVALGMLGGLLAAVGAVRLPIVQAVRGGG